ncbi:MAG: KH domain-containing protein [Clostridiales bacterium]|nr:KH domain-containing protein [Clostridiales bacterium]
MTDLSKTLKDIVSAIVDDPSQINVAETVDEDNHVTLKLSVAPDDMGKVIGKHGRIAQAIRTIMRTAAAENGQKVTVDIE